jgi:hypothetical protein
VLYFLTTNAFEEGMVSSNGQLKHAMMVLESFVVATIVTLLVLLDKYGT